MADGTTTTLQIRAYADPDLEALRVAIRTISLARR
jgi:hypothetical protein